MKKTYVYMIFIVAGFLYSDPLFSTNTNTQQRLSELQALIDGNLPYSENVTNDSIILWDKDIAPLLEQQKQYDTFFQLKQIVVAAYAQRGDISLAVDQARQMHKKAQNLDYKIGIALSLRAIGSAYLSAGMFKQAIESYEHSIQLLHKKDYAQRVQLLPRLIIILTKAGEMEKAAQYLKQLDEASTQIPSNTTYFFVQVSHAYYYVRNGEASKAKACITNADETSKIVNEPFYRAVLDLLQAFYYQEIGDNEQALNLYRKLNTENTPQQISAQHVDLYKEQAGLLERMGLEEEACYLYQQAYAKRDSLSVISYARQINDLRTIYQIDQFEIQNQKQLSTITFWSTIVIFLVLITIGGFVLYIIKKNKHLRQSKAILEEARKFSEASIHTKSLFLSNMSHEIRTPLNALSGFSYILTEENIDDETRQQCYDIIQQNSDLLLKLINDVVDLSNIELGKLTFAFHSYDAVSICRNVVDTVDKVKQTQASISFITSLESLELTTDNSRLQQVLINLLINATKFTTSGSITLELTKESDTLARFTVTDTGCGIPLEKQKEIFNRFEKLNEGAQGTGLGLSICQLIIEQLGGEIGIDPEYTNGSRFVFTHPIQPILKKEDAR